MTPQGHIPASAPPAAHEGSGIDLRLIRRIAGLIGFILVLLLVTVFLLLRTFEHKYVARTSEASPRVTAADLPPAPRPQIHPLRDLQESRAQEDLHLYRYSWVDRPQGVAQIPIDRAMNLWLRSYLAASPGVSLHPADGAAPPVTELQMRQQKAEEASHVP